MTCFALSTPTAASVTRSDGNRSIELPGNAAHGGCFADKLLRQCFDRFAFGFVGTGRRPYDSGVEESLGMPNLEEEAIWKRNCCRRIIGPVI